MPEMKDGRPKLLLACLAVMAAVLAWVLLSPEPTLGHGVGHPEFTAMRIGGDPDRHRELLLPGVCYGVAQLVFFGVLLSWGVKPSAQRVGRRWLALITALCVATFLMVIWFYYASLIRGSADRSPLWGMPWSTVCSVFGMWLVPLLFAGLFVWKFSLLVYDEQDAARFAEFRRQLESNDRAVKPPEQASSDG